MEASPDKLTEYIGCINNTPKRSHWPGELIALMDAKVRIHGDKQILREAIIVAIWQQCGKSTDKAADKLGLHQRSVRRIIHNWRKKMEIDPTVLSRQKDYILELMEQSHSGIKTLSAKVWQGADTAMTQILEDLDAGEFSPSELIRLFGNLTSIGFDLSKEGKGATAGRNDPGAMSNDDLLKQIDDKQRLIDQLRRMARVDGNEQTG